MKPVDEAGSVPLILFWASRKVVEILPFPSFSVAFLPARVEVGLAKARAGITRTRHKKKIA